MKTNMTNEYESPKCEVVFFLPNDAVMLVTSPTSGEDVTEGDLFNPWIV